MHAHLRHRRNARRLGFAFWGNVSALLLWVVMVPVTLYTGLKTSVPYLALISVYALIVGHMSSALAALAGKGTSENAERLHAIDAQGGVAAGQQDLATGQGEMHKKLDKLLAEKSKPATTRKRT